VLNHLYSPLIVDLDLRSVLENANELSMILSG
jgi:hypothetical protein